MQTKGRHRWFLTAAAAILLAVPAGVQAQIYSWRDANGTMVLSDHRPDGHVAVRTASYPVTGSQSVRSTREVGEPVSDRIDLLIETHAAAYRLRPDLVRAVIQTESAFNPRARSSKGAMGLMQLMPSTAADYGVLDPFDPDENIRGGTAYLRDLLVKYDGNEELALAAYNAGPTTVDRYGQRVPPYRETIAYVDRVRNASGQIVTSRARIFKFVEMVDGHQIVRYTNKKAGPGYQEVAAARRR